MAYSKKAKEKAEAAKKVRKYNPNVTGARLTRLRTTNPDAYKRLRKKEAARSVTSGQSGVKPRSAVSKTGPMKARKKSPKSKLMSAKKYTRAESKTPAAKKVKKRVVTSNILHKSGIGSGKQPVRTNKYKSVESAQGKKVKSQKNRWTGAGPNAVISRKGAGRKPKYGAAWRKGEGTQTSYTPTMQRAVREAKISRSKKIKKKSSPGSKSRSFRKRLGGY